MNAKNLKKQLMAAAAMTMVSVIALGSSTYAWFINNTLVTAGDVTVTAQASNTLLISQAGDDATTAWGTTTTLKSENNFAPKNALAPVSTIGSVDGATMNFFKSTGWTTEEDEDSGQVGEYLASGFEEVNADDTTEFFKDTFTIKASQACDLYLTDATKFMVGKDVTGDTTPDDALAKTLRLALVVTDPEDDTKTNTFFYQIDGKTENGANTTANAADGITTAISNTGLDDDGITIKNATDEISTDNMGTTTVNDKLTNVVKVLADECVSTKDGNNAVDATKLVIPDNVTDKLYSFDAADEECTVTAYIWMEGCDHDCIASNVEKFVDENNKVTATLGFGAAAPAPAPAE